MADERPHLAPLTASALPELSPDPGPARGLFAPFLGPRLDPRGIADEWQTIEEAATNLRVRAWSVPSLVGKTFWVDDLEGIAPALEAVLESACPGFPWTVAKRDARDWVGALHKYRIVHSSVDAPDDLATGQPMALELFGHAIALGPASLRAFALGLPGLLGLAPPFEWGGGQDTRLADALRDSEHPLEVEIAVATYANVRLPGFDVPFYA